MRTTPGRPTAISGRLSPDNQGVGIEFEERAKAMGAATPEPQSDSHALDGEAFKWVADSFVKDAGITPILHRLFVAPIMDGNTIKRVITESKADREGIVAERAIDATGGSDGEDDQCLGHALDVRSE